MRITLVLLLVNVAAFAIFVIARAPDEETLRHKDALWASGQMEISSADPFAYIAARPLRNWSNWHGGESTWVKLIEVPNLPALFVASQALHASDPVMRLSHYDRSWRLAWFFLAAAILQWVLIGLGMTWVLNRK